MTTARAGTTPRIRTRSRGAINPPPRYVIARIDAKPAATGDELHPHLFSSLRRPKPFRVPARMKVTGLAIVPPPTAADLPKVTPELLASVLARYSRSNEGIH